MPYARIMVPCSLCVVTPKVILCVLPSYRLQIPAGCGMFPRQFDVMLFGLFNIPKGRTILLIHTSNVLNIVIKLLGGGGGGGGGQNICMKVQN